MIPTSIQTSCRCRGIATLMTICGLACATAAEEPSNSMVPAGSSISRPSEPDAPTPALREERLVGENQQPEWTTRRRFATVRSYVLPPWQFEFEQWWSGFFPRVGRGEHLFQEEISVGLPYRFQVDVYENHEINSASTWRHQGVATEMRYAFADWGKIPLNPTIYLEWKFDNNDIPDAGEIKLLFTEEIAPRWHWGMNLFYEQEMSGTREIEWGVSHAISYTLIDEKLAVGVEMQFNHVTEHESRSAPSLELLVGPSVQWRPTPRTHLDIVPLMGVTPEAPRVWAWVVFGVDFGPGRDKGAPVAPISSRSR